MLPKLLVLLAALVLAACDGTGSSTCTQGCVTVNDGGTLIHGSGNTKTETRPVAPLTAIRVASAVTVVIERTGGETLSVTGDDNLLSLFTSEVKDGTLSLSSASGKSFEGKMPVFRVTVGDLRQLDLVGSSTARVSKLDSDALSISIAGSATLHAAGQVNDLTVSVSGSGTADVAQLTAKRAKVVVSGSGDLTVNASDELDAKVTGSGSIRYIGSPKLTPAVSGSGSIKKKSI